jgi:glycosyltransferase involved in cell wall biosynthesis
LGKAIVYVAGKDPLEERGGHSTYVRAHARAAIRAGFEPHLFCASCHNGQVRTDYGVVHRVLSPLRFLPQRSGAGFRTHTVVWHVPLIARQVTQFLAARPGPHLVHGFGVWGSAAVTAARRLGRQGVSAVPIASAYTLVDHEVVAKLRGHRKVHGAISRLQTMLELSWARYSVIHHERWAYYGARLVGINYESVRWLLEASWGKGIAFRRMAYGPETAFDHESPEKTPIVPDALAALAPAGAPLIVSVSRHDARKGVDVLLRALARLLAAGVRFRACLVGGGPLLATHRALAKSLGLDGAVLVTGLVPDAYAYLRCADVFALPSLEEGSGSLSLLEALQAGVAPVASAIDGIPEDVTDGRSAILVPPGNEGALAAALARAVQNPVLRRDLAREARAAFDARFSASSFSASLSKVYGELGFVP